MTVAELAEYLRDLPPDWNIALVFKFEQGIVTGYIAADRVAGAAARRVKRTDHNGVYVTSDVEKTI